MADALLGSLHECDCRTTNCIAEEIKKARVSAFLLKVLGVTCSEAENDEHSIPKGVNISNF